MVTEVPTRRFERAREGIGMLRAHDRPAPAAVRHRRRSAPPCSPCARSLRAWPCSWVIDHVIVPRFDEGSVATSTVLTGVGMIIGIGLLRAAGVVVRRTFAGTAQWRIAGTLGRSVIDRLVRQPMAWHDRRPDGDLVARAGVDTDAAVSVLAPVPFATGTVLLIVVSAVFMLATDLVMGVAAVAVFPVLIGLNVVYQRRVDVYYGEAQDHLGALSAGVHESFEGVQLVKAYGAEARETERLAEIAGRLRVARVGAVRLRGTFEALLDVLPSMTNVGLVLLGAFRVRSGDLTVGELSSFVYLFTLLVFPLRLIGYALSELPHSLAGWKRVRTVLDEPIEPDPRAAIEQAPDGTGVRLDDVTFTFAGESRAGAGGRHARRRQWADRRRRRADGCGQDDARRGRRRPARAVVGPGGDRRRPAGGRVPGGVPVRRLDPPQPRARHAAHRRRGVAGAAAGSRRRVRRRHCRRASTRSSASAASASVAASASASRWPGRSCGDRRCCCSTTRPRHSIRRPKPPCSATCAARSPARRC